MDSKTCHFLCKGPHKNRQLLLQLLAALGVKRMDPALLQKCLSSTGLALDMLGALLVAIDAMRGFTGIKATVGATWDTLGELPKETEEYKKHIKINKIIIIFGLWCFVFGFGLQLLSNWPEWKISQLLGMPVECLCT